MESASSAKIRIGLLFAESVLALICLSTAVSRATVAQYAAGSKTGGYKLEAQTKTTTPKQHPKAAAQKANTSTKTNTSTSAKSHTASHPSANTHSKSSGAAGPKSKSKQASLRKTGKHGTARGQQKIDPERAQAIQEALIREHYLSGEAGGTWNQASEDAMRRYQADHGWQSKTVPDSRALISLGLGPSHDHLLNPQSAMTTGPEAPRAASLTPASQSPDPGASPKPIPSSDPTRVPASSQDASGPQ